VLLVPKLDGRYARVGTVARIESGGDLPNGVRPWYCVPCTGPVVHAGVAGDGRRRVCGGRPGP